LGVGVVHIYDENEHHAHNGSAAQLGPVLRYPPLGSINTARTPIAAWL
jgi:hypothetical protein